MKLSSGGWRIELAFRAAIGLIGGVSQVLMRYRGREIRGEDLELIRQLIAANPQLSRRRLSARLCEEWNWVQPNGALRDMVCRGLMLALHRGGLIELPPPRSQARNNAITHRRVRDVEPVDETRIEGPLTALGPLEIRLVRRREGEHLFAHLLNRHHYLGSQASGH